MKLLIRTLSSFLQILFIAGFTLKSHSFVLPPQQIFLEGRWESECVNGKKTEMIIINSQSSLLETFYQEGNCLNPIFSIETQGLLQYPPLESAGSLRDTPLLWPVDYSYLDIFLTPQSESVVEQFNRLENCSINHWSLKFPQKITGLHCQFSEGTRPFPIPEKGQMRYGVYQIYEPFLFFGQNNALEDSSTPFRRPTTLQTIPLKRVLR